MGETADIVNAGVSVIKLAANHAGTFTRDGQYAAALPKGTSGDDMAEWSPKKVGLTWKQASDWYEFWNVDWDFTVSMKWNYNGTPSDHVGRFSDQVTITLDVRHLPPDFTLDVTATFPPNGLNYGSHEEPVGGLEFTTIVEMKGFLGQLVSWSKSLDCSVRGDGNWSMA